MTAEDKAWALLNRLGCHNARNLSSGEIIELANLVAENEHLKGVLRMILDQVDYTNNACSPTEMVGAVLSKQAIEKAKNILKNTK